MPPRIESFDFRDQVLTAQFTESMEVALGVSCDVYAHPETQERDLAIVAISAGHQTPMQRVLEGEETIEGYLSGKGKLIIIQNDGSIAEYQVDSHMEGFSYSVQIGETMQWQADVKESLTIFEVCYPPFAEGRFENISTERI